MSVTIPVLEVAPLFGQDPLATRDADRALAAAAREPGFACIRAVPIEAVASIAPLPLDPPDLFEPFTYGDFLWRRMTSFIEFRGLDRERPGRN